MFLIVCGWSLTGGGEHAPNGADGFTFRRGADEGDCLLSWGHRYCARGFLKRLLLEGFVIFGREILSLRTQLSMKALVSLRR